MSKISSEVVRVKLPAETMAPLSIPNAEPNKQRILRSCPGRCRGRHVVALLISVDGELFVGTNGITVPQEGCPRKARGCRRGEGWELCREICGQSGHAEANAIRVAGARAIGGTLLLIGHDTVCEDCVTLMRQAGIDKCVIVSDSGSKNMGEFK